MLCVIPEIAEILQKLQIFSTRYSSFSVLFNHSENFTGETRHIVSPCNKARISNFCVEFQKLQKLQISLKCYSSFSSYSIILKFLLVKLGIQCHPITKLEFQIFFCLEFQKLLKLQIFSKRYSSFSSYSMHSEMVTGETRHIVPPLGPSTDCV